VISCNEDALVASQKRTSRFYNRQSEIKLPEQVSHLCLGDRNEFGKGKVCRVRDFAFESRIFWFEMPAQIAAGGRGTACNRGPVLRRWLVEIFLENLCNRLAA
jgi:hypothetical protein